MKYVITGGTGFLGGHIQNVLKEKNMEFDIPRRSDYDLRYKEDADRLFNHYRRDDVVVINLAASVGGIGFNRAHPYSLYYDNLMINTNVIDACVRLRIPKLVQIGTTCSYPKHCPTPFQEGSLFDGYPEETNAPYGIAKRASLVQLQAAYQEYDFNGVYVLPTNLYGPFDTFAPEKSHVVPALIKKFFDAIDNKEKEVVVWGTGRATRDFLYVEDAARGILKVAEQYDNPMQPVNLGSNEQTSITILVHFIEKILGWKGQVVWDKSKPDGQPKRLLDTRVARSQLDWKAEVKLREGLTRTIEWYKGIRYGG